MTLSASAKKMQRYMKYLDGVPGPSVEADDKVEHSTYGEGGMSEGEVENYS